MSKISRRSFIETAVIGSGLLGSAALLGTPLPFREEKPAAPGGPAAAGESVSTVTPQKRVSGGDFIHWSFGGQENASPMQAKSSDFRLWMDPSIERKRYHFREEVVKACQGLDEKRKGKTIALCLSGGVDSEIIAVTLKQLSIPFEFYFLDNWGLNAQTYNHWVRPFAERMGKKTHVVRLDRSYFLEEYARMSFLELGCEYPTYLAMTYLFSQIPADQFIVVGDGDVERVGDLFSFIGKNHPVEPAQLGTHLPFASSSVAYRLWAEGRGRAGSYYFFSQTPELIASTLTDPKFMPHYPIGHTKNVIHAAFPEIQVRDKTTNWDGAAAQQENSLVRQTIRNFAKSQPELEFWKPATGTAVNVHNIFLS